MQVTVACTQMHSTWAIEENIKRAEALVNKAADLGANIVLLQELFETPYFCQDQTARHFALAHEAATSPLLAARPIQNGRR